MSHPSRAAVGLLLLCAILAFALFVTIRPIRPDGPMSGGGRTLLTVDEALGATVEPVDPVTGVLLRLQSSSGDLVVTSIGTGGPAAAAGIRVGDIIERIDGKPAAASAAPRGPTAVMINRGGKHVILQIAFRGTM